MSESVIKARNLFHEVFLPVLRRDFPQATAQTAFGVFGVFGHGSVVAIIRLRWGRWAAAGFPTAWENWNVDFPDGSQCHAFSAHPRYHLAAIGLR